MKFFSTIKTCFRNYVSIQGTISRSEYWFWIIFVILILAIATIVDGIFIAPMLGYLTFDHEAGRPLFWVLLAILALPTITATIRRFHDSARPGWYLLVCIIVAISGFFVMRWAVSLMSLEMATAINDYISLELLYFASFLPLLYFLAKSGVRQAHKYSEDN